MSPIPFPLPDTVQDITIFRDTQEFVICCDLVEVSSFLIGKEQIWLPDGVQHRWVQV